MRHILAHIATTVVTVAVTGLVLFGIQEAVRQQNEYKEFKEATLPVVGKMVISKVTMEDGKLALRVFVDKQRQCGPPLAINGSYGPKFEKKITRITFSQDKRKDGTYVVPDANPITDGLEDFGIWTFDPNPYPENLLIEVLHSCEGQVIRYEKVVNLMQDLDEVLEDLE